MKYVVWDFDGTLAERESAWSGALVEAAAKRGLNATRDAVRPFLQSGFPWHSPEVAREGMESPEDWWGRLEPIFCQAFETGAGIEIEQSQLLAREVRTVYLDVRRWRLFDDVIPCLDKLSTSGCCHLILSNHVPELEELVLSLGIGSYFARIISSAVTGVEKPNPKAFENVLELVGKDSELWMIGDNWTADVCGAEQVGIQSILVRKPHSDAKRFCSTLAELPMLLGAR